jgi:cobalt-zinc-cadmium efflux system membrane fusion protein
VNAFPGQFIERTGELLGVLDLSHIHVELDLPEAHLPQVQHKIPFTFRLTRLPGQVFDAEVYSTGCELNTERRTVRVHGHIKNEQDPVLRPGMSVVAHIPIKSAERLSVASGALLPTEEGWVAFQQLATGRYRRVLLTRAYKSGSFDILGDEVKAGTKWETKGAGRLDAQ